MFSSADISFESIRRYKASFGTCNFFSPLIHMKIKVFHMKLPYSRQTISFLLSTFSLSKVFFDIWTAYDAPYIQDQHTVTTLLRDQ